MRYRPRRRDANHTALVALLVEAGYSVVDLSAVGKGCPDLLVGAGGREMLVEVKNPARRTRGDNAAKTMQRQAEFREAWGGRPVLVAETAAQVFEQLPMSAK